MTVRMREPDSVSAPFYLLEEISKPQACLSAGRISVFVYDDGAFIREIVVAGHAESATCSSATAILIEAAKRFDDSIEWMLTCGAGYFRIVPSKADGAVRAQALFGNMIRLLQEVADEKGLIDIVHRDWHRLSAFRRRFLDAAAAPSAHLLLPETGGGEAEVIDYAPITVGTGRDAKPLEFRLEGWDFDCPEFQAVADIHLRNLQRELLRDALRRRSTYRGWLREWVEDWVRALNMLPRWQAEQAVLEVPAPIEGLPPMATTAADFLNSHARRFLDRGQSWYRNLAYIVGRLPYGQGSDADLDEPRHAKTINVIDFQRGLRYSRPATPDDPPFTWRQRILHNDPRMISECLNYIRDMDTIIAPYEKLRTSSREPGDAVEASISKQIIVETMVRGWPSVFMTDEADKKAFAAWSDKYRPHVWEILSKQARAHGVAPDILIEDNVVYDVRFDNDLGCLIRPLMLVDDATHAQLHGSRTGASVAIPLWPRKTPQSMPSAVLTLAPTNRERAARLVRLAADQTARGNANISGAAELLRQALACHPGEAGRLILQEWSRRLGRDTSSEFMRARSFTHAAELLRKFRYAEAGQAIAAYLKDEPKPAVDAYVIAAIAALHHDATTRADIFKKMNDYQRLARRHDELAERLRGEHERGRQVSMHDLDLLKTIRQEIDRLTSQLDAWDAQIKSETERVAKLIEKALKKPGLVKREHPELAAAATHAHDVLQATLENNCLYPGSKEASLRYEGIRGTIETRGLLDILFELWKIAYNVERAPNETRRQTVAEVERLSTALWLPGEIESDLRVLAEEFAKGDWDRLQSLQILSVLRNAMTTCKQRMRDLLGSPVITGVPLKETLTTRIHIDQTIETRFKTALDMLLGAKIALGGAIDQPWTVIDETLVDFPDQGRFTLDGNVVAVESGETRTPILEAAMSAADRELVQETIADPDLPARLNRFASCVAEALLAVEIEPRREWRHWRDAMALLIPELIVSLSSFRHEANLMPDHTPPTVESEPDVERKMNTLVPHTYPAVDWQWSKLGEWEQLAGAYGREPLVF